MRLNRLDLNLLVCLDALLAERNVSRAATRVFLSQPAMSVALRRLREHFGDELLIHTGRSYSPTTFASSLQRPVRDMVLQLRALSGLRPNFDPTRCDRTIRIEASDYVSTILMTRVLKRAAESAPHMKFDVRLPESNFVENLESGETDLLVIPQPLCSREHPSQVLFTDTFSCVVWEGNSQIRKRITRQQYLQAGHVVAEWNAGRLPALDEEELVRRGFRRRREVTTQSFWLSPQFVIGTQRIATVQTRLAQFMVTRWPIRLLPSPIQTSPLIETVQWHRHQERDDAILWVLELLKSVARELMDEQPGKIRSRKRAPFAR
jgi:LysR family transcriptional regulator, nod-box dependent transcriptional activator